MSKWRTAGLLFCLCALVWGCSDTDPFADGELEAGVRDARADALQGGLDGATARDGGDMDGGPGAADAGDASAMDGAAPDGAVADGALFDGAVADGAVGDGAVGDARPADGAPGDGGIPPVQITTSNPLADAIEGEPYSVTFTASGGTSGYAWTGIDLPWGTLSADGEWSGTPPEAGSDTVTVRVDSGSDFDEGTFDVTVHDKLVSTVPDSPVAGMDGLDLTTFVDGGEGPVACATPDGPGAGALPSGVQLGGADGCTLQGLPDDSNTPGGYGVMAVVEDAVGQQVKVPVFYSAGECSTSAVTLDPGGNAERVEPAGSAYSWAFEVTNLDAPCDGDCSNGCGWCYNLSLVGSPLPSTQDLECANEGSVCSDCNDCVSEIQSCPDVATMSRSLDVKAHSPLTSDGSPGWLTLDVSIDYSGDINTADTCGDKHWECHLSVLEVP